MAAEGRDRHICLQSLGRPSMGPRPDGRGRSFCALMRMSRTLPSMGPRPDGRGREVYIRGGARAWTVNGAAAGWPRKATALPCPSPPLGPSMGPRPDGRGRRRRPRAPCGTPRRQWGRGRMAAEGPRPPRLAPRPNAPSMGPRPDGRGRLGVPVLAPFGDVLPSMGPRPDGRGRAREVCRALCGRLPSMGPRPDGRGRAAHRADGARRPCRQWGRGRMAAEGSLACIAASQRSFRQWGPCLSGPGRSGYRRAGS